MKKFYSAVEHISHEFSSEKQSHIIDLYDDVYKRTGKKIMSKSTNELDGMIAEKKEELKKIFIQMRSKMADDQELFSTCIDNGEDVKVDTMSCNAFPVLESFISISAEIDAISDDLIIRRAEIERRKRLKEKKHEQHERILKFMDSIILDEEMETYW